VVEDRDWTRRSSFYDPVRGSLVDT